MQRLPPFFFSSVGGQAWTASGDEKSIDCCCSSVSLISEHCVSCEYFPSIYLSTMHVNECHPQT
jgi:hypothetical protein